MPADSHLVARSGSLKRELVEFAESPRFASALRKTFDTQLEPYEQLDDAQYINVLDHFILQYKLPDGRTVVDRFVAAHPELPEEEQALLLGWRDVVEGIFEIERRDGEALVTLNLVDELPYRIRSNAGPGALVSMRPRTFVIGRIVPIQDEWLLSGVSSVLTAEQRDDAYQAAGRLSLSRPALAFRNPEKLRQGWELQREDRRYFVEYFGADLVIVPGPELAERMRAYMHFRQNESRDAQGKTVAEKVRESKGTEPPEPPEIPLPEHVQQADSVGVLYDEVEGLNFMVDYGAAAATFADPELAGDRRYRKAVLHYLEDESIAPRVLERLAAADPERASRVFRRILKRPDFDWERDGGPLLRRYKASWYERTPLPGVTPVSERQSPGEIKRPGAAAGPRQRPQLRRWPSFRKRY